MQEEKQISPILSEETKELLNSPIFKDFIFEEPSITTKNNATPLSPSSTNDDPITHSQLNIDTKASVTLNGKEITNSASEKTPLSGLKSSATCSTLYDIENLEKEDIRSIEKYFHTYSEKLYISGLLYKRNDFQPDGKPFPTVSGPLWTKWWVELWGPVLKFWRVTEENDYLSTEDKNSSKVKHIIQTELVPHPDTVKKIKDSQETKYINISDSVVDLINYTVDEQPPFPYNNFLTLSTAGLNLFTLATSTSYLANSWVVAIRLSCFEQSKLNELYTYRLLKRSCFFNTWYSYEYNPLELPNALIQPITPSDYKNVHYEGYIQARINYATEWKRYWIVISSKQSTNTSTNSTSGMSEFQSVAKKFLKKKNKQHSNKSENSLYSQFSSSASSLEEGSFLSNAGNILFYEDKKDVKKNKPVMEVTNAFQIYAVWPEKPEIVESGAGGVIKIEGEVIAANGKMKAQLENRSDASFVLFMLPTLKELVKCVICSLGTFQLSPAGLAGKSKQHIISSVPINDKYNFIIDPTYVSKVDIENIKNMSMGNPGEDDSSNIGIFSKNYNSKPIDDNSDELDIRTWGLLYLSLPEVHNININEMSNIMTKVKYSQILALKRDARQNLNLQYFRDEVEESIRCKCIKERKEIEKKISSIKKNSVIKDTNKEKSTVNTTLNSSNLLPSENNKTKNYLGLNMPILDFNSTSPIDIEKEINKTFNSETIVNENTHENTTLNEQESKENTKIEETNIENILEDSNDDKPFVSPTSPSKASKKSPVIADISNISASNNDESHKFPNNKGNNEKVNTDINNQKSKEAEIKQETQPRDNSESESESDTESESESESDNELPVGMTLAATGIDVANLSKSPIKSPIKSPYLVNQKSPNIENNKELKLSSSSATPSLFNNGQTSFISSSSPAIAESTPATNNLEKLDGDRSVTTVPTDEEGKTKKYAPSEFESLVMDAADAVAALSIDQFAEIKEEDESDESEENGMIEPPEMPSTPPPPGKQYALVAQPILSEDGEQVISWSYSYQLVDTEQYNMAQKLQEQADMESDEEEDDDDDDESVSSDDIPLANARMQNNYETNEYNQIPIRDAINMFQGIDPTSEEFSKLLQSQRMSVLKGESTLTPAELANLQLQLQQHKEDGEQNQPPTSFQLFAPNSLMAQREKVNAQRKILEEQQQKIREEYGTVHTGPLLGTVNKDSKKPKLEGGLVGELDRRAREKEILKKMGLYKPPPPQEHIPSYLQKSGGVQSNPHLSMQNQALLNRQSIFPPPQVINNPLIRPPLLQPPLIRNSMIQNPMMNFGQPGFYPPVPPASLYGVPPPQSTVIPNPAVPRHLDYEFDDTLNIHERDNLAKSWLEKEREKERQRQYERKNEHNMRMSKSFPSNINNLVKNYSDSDNEDEPLGNIANSKKKYKKNKKRLESESDSTESETTSSSESETESETESESESGTESDSDSKRKSKKKKSNKSLNKENSSIFNIEKNSNVEGMISEKKKGKSSAGGEFEDIKKAKRYFETNSDDSSISSSSSSDDGHRRNNKYMHSSHYPPQSGRTDNYYRHQPPQNVVNPYGSYVNSFNPNMYNRMYSSPALGNVTPGSGRRYSYSDSDDNYSSNRRYHRHRNRDKHSKRHRRRRSSSDSSYSSSEDTDTSYSSDYSHRRRRHRRHRDKDRSKDKSNKKSHKKKSSKKSHKKDDSDSSSSSENDKLVMKDVQTSETKLNNTSIEDGLSPEILEELEDCFDQFMEECIEMKPKFQVTQEELYNTFINWWNKLELAKKANGKQPSLKNLENIMIDNGFTLRPWKKSKNILEPPSDSKDVWHNLRIKQ
ncbi:hypothetical protein U3516DRAFT_743547 [Neocallimastix sp. 'constans']|jgi:hypothetical protein